MRYLYRGRSFQVVVDGFDGAVLYGKAPGQRALPRGERWWSGMALGASLAIDVPGGDYLGFQQRRCRLGWCW